MDTPPSNSMNKQNNKNYQQNMQQLAIFSCTSTKNDSVAESKKKSIGQENVMKTHNMFNQVSSSSLSTTMNTQKQNNLLQTPPFSAMIQRNYLFSPSAQNNNNNSIESLKQQPQLQNT